MTYFELIEKLAINTEIADIEGRKRNISLFVIGFNKKNGRMPTDEECDAEIANLKSKLGE